MDVMIIVIARIENCYECFWVLPPTHERSRNSSNMTERDLNVTSTIELYRIRMGWGTGRSE